MHNVIKTKMHSVELKKAIVGLNQGSLTISQYFTKLKILWEELNSYKPLINCSCGGSKP